MQIDFLAISPQLLRMPIINIFLELRLKYKNVNITRTLGSLPESSIRAKIRPSYTVFLKASLLLSTKQNTKTTARYTVEL